MTEAEDLAAKGEAAGPGAGVGLAQRDGVCRGRGDGGRPVGVRWLRRD